MSGEVHIVLLWPNALDAREKIFAALAERFKRLKAYRVEWSERHFAANMSRFYGKNLPPDSDKIADCGTGPFVVAIVEDTAPVEDYRWTSKGGTPVNVNLFDAKERFREWTGGGHLIHTSITAAEADHDATLLFGRTAASFLDGGREDWDAPLEDLARDLGGAGGWRDLRELFDTLNAAHIYVVLRNFDALPDGAEVSEHGDIDLLVEDFEEAAFILGAEPIFDTPNRVHMKISIAGTDLAFDLRHQGDGYYDTLWERDILDRRVMAEGGFYTPAPDDHFYSLLYHGLVHKPRVAPDYMVKLTALANALGYPDATPDHFANDRWMKAVLGQFLKARGYEYTHPQDPSVYVNRTLLPADPEQQARDMEDRFGTLVSAAMLTPPVHSKTNDLFASKVWRMTMPDGTPAALKVVEALNEDAQPLLFREHEFLVRLNQGGFMRHLAHGDLDGRYLLVTRWVEGADLFVGEAEIERLRGDRDQAEEFRKSCLEIVEHLESAGICHRDIRERNIIVEDGKPVLIDFGWAVFGDEADCFTPPNLEQPDDRSAMENMLDRLLG